MDFSLLFYFHPCQHVLGCKVLGFGIEILEAGMSLERVGFLSTTSIQVVIEQSFRII